MLTHLWLSAVFKMEQNAFPSILTNKQNLPLTNTLGRCFSTMEGGVKCSIVLSKSREKLLSLPQPPPPGSKKPFLPNEIPSKVNPTVEPQGPQMPPWVDLRPSSPKSTLRRGPWLVSPSVGPASLARLLSLGTQVSGITCRLVSSSCPCSKCFVCSRFSTVRSRIKQNVLKKGLWHMLICSLEVYTQLTPD